METEEFRIRSRFGKKRILLFLAMFYAIAIPTFVYLGFRTERPGVSAYAKEVVEATGMLEVPSISLSAPMSDVELNGRTLSAPNYIVGRYKSFENKVLVIGHSSTVFQRLNEVVVGDKVVYDGREFEVVSREVKAKADISMREILGDEKEPTLVLMTCSGEHISGQDYSHRLIIYAVMRSK